MISFKIVLIQLNFWRFFFWKSIRTAIGSTSCSTKSTDSFEHLVLAAVNLCKSILSVHAIELCTPKPNHTLPQNANQKWNEVTNFTLLWIYAVDRERENVIHSSRIYHLNRKIKEYFVYFLVCSRVRSNEKKNLQYLSIHMHT